MRAQAIRSWAKQTGDETFILRPLEASSRLYRLGTWAYNSIQRTWPGLHNGYFAFLEHARLHRRRFGILGAKRFSQVVNRMSPDVIVSVHAHLNHGYRDLALRALPDKPPAFAVYCGELGDGPGFSRHWINPRVDLFAAPTEETCGAALDRGMPEEKVFQAGLLLRPAFFEKPTKASLGKLVRETLELDPKLPILALGTGANGVNRHLQVVLSLRRSGLPAQVVALCGENRKTIRWLETIGEPPKVSLRILPTRSDEEMSKILRVASLLYARPGAGTTSEALACGTPILFDVSRGIMPQEQNNLNFWERRTGQLVTARSPSDFPRLMHAPVRSVPWEQKETPLRFIEKLHEVVSSR